jgi:hypothetical protein
MVAQPTKEHRLFAPSNSANASVRQLSSGFRFLAHSHLTAARQLSSPVNSNAPCSSYDHHHSDVGSPPCHRSNPHSQSSLLLPTL